MIEQSRDTLKEFFETGDKPTELQFSDFVDSVINKEDDKVFVRGINNDISIGLGKAPLTPSQVANYGYLRLDVEGKIKTDNLQLPHGADTGKVLISDDTDGNVRWELQSNLDDFDWKVQGNDMWNYNSGNVGVGTQTPADKMHVQGQFRVQTSQIQGEGWLGVRVYNENPNGTSNLLLGTQHGVNPYWELSKRGQGIGNHLTLTYWDPVSSTGRVSMFIDGGSHDIKLDTNRLEVTGRVETGSDAWIGGNVGIGNTSPGERLVVSGRTQTNELRITNLQSGANNSDVLTVDGAGNVQRVAAGGLQIQGFGLWEEQGNKILSKTGRNVQTRQDLYVDWKLAIGTDTPSYDFHMKKDSGFLIGAVENTSSADWTKASLWLSNSATQTHWEWTAMRDSNNDSVLYLSKIDTAPNPDKSLDIFHVNAQNDLYLLPWKQNNQLSPGNTFVQQGNFNVGYSQYDNNLGQRLQVRGHLGVQSGEINVWYDNAFKNPIVFRDYGVKAVEVDHNQTGFSTADWNGAIVSVDSDFASTGLKEFIMHESYGQWVVTIRKEGGNTINWKYTCMFVRKELSVRVP